MTPKRKPKDFTRNDRVAYKPRHKEEERWGTVSTTNDTYVFVKFDEQVSKLGWDGTTSQGCLPEQLRKE